MSTCWTAGVVSVGTSGVSQLDQTSSTFSSTFSGVLGCSGVTTGASTFGASSATGGTSAAAVVGSEVSIGVLSSDPLAKPAKMSPNSVCMSLISAIIGKYVIVCNDLLTFCHVNTDIMSASCVPNYIPSSTLKAFS